MWNQKIYKISFMVLVSAITGTGLYGCDKQGYSVLAATGTVIGVEVSQNPATQFPQGKLGYNRSELAFVPTNRDGGSGTGTTHTGANETGNVLMELRYGDIFDTKSSSIYQRLAVGDIAVAQQGAAVMFAKNAQGSLDAEAEKALQAVKSIPVFPESKGKLRAEIARKYSAYKHSTPPDTASMAKYDNAATKIDPKYSNYKDFALDPDASQETIKAVCLLLKDQGETLTCD